ncbi:hypothetical protein QJ854_gp533 [Moumouvirus goulette]|uniref:Uncharacterized protein n=1 Tax=Moumouvirus goulette TaxID=1247379 RepID=M1PBF3_9VIRU|nr:hypothetical protein QJ854_gp533 [Moumouvirus goulette]AGF85249.1 hypothetical protein glt_00440 [Moumouvirus goulette]
MLNNNLIIIYPNANTTPLDTNPIKLLGLGKYLLIILDVFGCTINTKIIINIIGITTYSTKLFFLREHLHIVFLVDPFFDASFDVVPLYLIDSDVQNY